MAIPDPTHRVKSSVKSNIAGCRVACSDTNNGVVQVVWHSSFAGPAPRGLALGIDLVHAYLSPSDVEPLIAAPYQAKPSQSRLVEVEENGTRFYRVVDDVLTVTCAVEIRPLLTPSGDRSFSEAMASYQAATEAFWAEEGKRLVDEYQALVCTDLRNPCRELEMAKPLPGVVDSPVYIQRRSDGSMVCRDIKPRGA